MKSKFLAFLTLIPLLMITSCSKECTHNYIYREYTHATHISEGKKVYFCTKCGDTYDEILPKLAEHEFSYEYIDESTHKATCPCGEVRNENHSYTLKETVKPIHYDFNVDVYECICGHTFMKHNEEIIDDSHKYSQDWSKLNSHQHLKTCSCGDKIVEDHHFSKQFYNDNDDLIKICDECNFELQYSFDTDYLGATDELASPKIAYSQITKHSTNPEYYLYHNVRIGDGIYLDYSNVLTMPNSKTVLAVYIEDSLQILICTKTNKTNENVFYSNIAGAEISPSLYDSEITTKLYKISAEEDFAKLHEDDLKEENLLQVEQYKISDYFERIIPIVDTNVPDLLKAYCVACKNKGSNTEPSSSEFNNAQVLSDEKRKYYPSDEYSSYCELFTNLTMSYDSSISCLVNYLLNSDDFELYCDDYYLPSSEGSHKNIKLPRFSYTEYSKLHLLKVFNDENLEEPVFTMTINAYQFLYFAFLGTFTSDETVDNSMLVTLTNFVYIFNNV